MICCEYCEQLEERVKVLESNVEMLMDEWRDKLT